MQCAIYCAFLEGGGHTDVVKVSKTQKKNLCMKYDALGIKGKMYDLW